MVPVISLGFRQPGEIFCRSGNKPRKIDFSVCLNQAIIPGWKLTTPTLSLPLAKIASAVRRHKTSLSEQTLSSAKPGCTAGNFYQIRAGLKDANPQVPNNRFRLSFYLSRIFLKGRCNCLKPCFLSLKGKCLFLCLRRLARTF